MSEEEEIITLTDDEGKEHDFILIDILKVDETDYAILLPSDDENDEAIILKIIADDEGNETLVEIEEDEEWEKVADAWNERCEEEEDDDEE